VFRGGELIREARLRSGLTQQDLADRLGTSQSVIARWESGRRSPTVETLLRAVRSCGLDLSMSVVSYDHDHELMIRRNLTLPPGARLDKLVEDRKGIQELVSPSR
jgi:transcriptional regulator with XRE-family HTH domain